jgi:hypothetical protein
MKKILLLLIFSMAITITKAQTMVAGDIAFIGYNTATPDGFCFIALKNLPGGETLFFTDMGWAGSGWMTTVGEPHLKYVLPAGGIPKGTIISIVESSTANTLVLTGITGGTLTYAIVNDFNLSGGDQILAYQSTGNVAMPPFQNLLQVYMAITTALNMIQSRNGIPYRPHQWIGQPVIVHFQPD